MDAQLLQITAQVLFEKLQSLRSKMQDDVATPDDRVAAAMLEEVVALARNRYCVAGNEAEFQQGKSVWVERTAATHFPHIRLHGGALEDDPIA